jgi:serine beta-lactamase-like protein LACTB, mitochondrial
LGSLALGLALLAAPGEATTPLPPAQVLALESAVDAFMADRKVPGLTAAVVVDRRVRWTKGFGLADVENAVAATPETMYRLASVSKPMTATAVMQLVEKGKIDLDAPVQRYVPSFPEKPWPLTSRQLLAHLGGIRHYYPDEHFDASRHYASILEGLDVFKEDPLVHEPGTAFLYSTYGYTLLGAVVEAASGRPFVDYLRENVWRPAGMESIRDDDSRAIVLHRAQGYARIANGDVRNSAAADTSYKIPGGGLIATASDVARFAAALQGGTTLVRSDTLATMFAKQRTRSGRLIGYGLGWSLEQWKGRRAVLHTGGQERVNNVLYMLPDRGVAVAILTDLEGCQPTELARKLAEILAP